MQSDKHHVIICSIQSHISYYDVSYEITHKITSHIMHDDISHISYYAISHVRTITCKIPSDMLWDMVCVLDYRQTRDMLCKVTSDMLSDVSRTITCKITSHMLQTHGMIYETRHITDDLCNVTADIIHASCIITCKTIWCAVFTDLHLTCHVSCL